MSFIRIEVISLLFLCVALSDGTIHSIIQRELEITNINRTTERELEQPFVGEAITSLRQRLNSFTDQGADQWWQQFVPLDTITKLDVPLTESCSVTTSLAIDRCTTDMIPNPEGCVTVEMFVKSKIPSILPQLSDVLTISNININLNDWHIDVATIDTCPGIFPTEVTLAKIKIPFPSSLRTDSMISGAINGRLNIANGLIRVEGQAGEGYSAYVEVGGNQPVAAIISQGKISVLGLSQTTNITLDHQGYHSQLSGNILNLFQADLLLNASYQSLGALSVSVEGFFQSPLKIKIQQMIKSTLNNYKEKAGLAIGAAQNKVNSAKKSFDIAIRKMNLVKADVNKANLAFNKFGKVVESARAEVRSAQAAFVKASNSILGAQRSVNSLQRNYDNAIASLKRAERSLDSQQQHFDSAVRVVNSKRDVLNRKQRDVDKAVAKMRAKERSCPRPCRTRRDDSEADVFLNAPSAKAVLVREKRGLFDWFERRKEDAARGARKLAEKTRKAAARASQFMRCSALRAGAETCKAGVRVLANIINLGKVGLEVAKDAVSAAAKVVNASRRSLDVAKFGLRAAQVVVDKNRWPLDVAKKVLQGAAGVVQASKHSLTVAEGAMKVAEVAVNKSRVILDVAKGVLNTASNAVQIAKRSLDMAVLGLEVVKRTNAFGVEIGKKKLVGLFLVDVQEIRYRAELSDATVGRFDATMRIAFFSSQPKTFHVKLDLKNLGPVVASLANSAKKLLGF